MANTHGPQANTTQIRRSAVAEKRHNAAQDGERQHRAQVDEPQQLIV